MNQVSVQTLRQMIAVSLATLWVLCLFYRPINALDYTYLEAFLDGLFNWRAGFSWYSRIILIAPIALLAGVTVIYVQSFLANSSIKSWMVTAAMMAAFSLHSAYSGFIMWGQDLVSLFLVYSLNLEYSVLQRVVEWAVEDDYWQTHWFNIVVPFAFQLCLSSYRQILRLEKQQRPPKQILAVMPSVPLHGYPVTMPIVPT